MSRISNAPDLEDTRQVARRVALFGAVSLPTDARFRRCGPVLCRGGPNFDGVVIVSPRMTRIVSFVIAFLLYVAAYGQEGVQVRIQNRPSGLAWGTVEIPVVSSGAVEKLVLYTNGVRWAEIDGRAGIFRLELSKFLRRLRIRVDGLSAEGQLLASDEMVINDPQPPFRVRLVAVEPQVDLDDATGSLAASVTAPPGSRITSVDFYVGETLISRDTAAPYGATWNSGELGDASYARVVARDARGNEANDVQFFGSGIRETVDVVLERVPVSAPGGGSALRKEDLVLRIGADEHPIEALQSASDQPLDVILLMDSSESMLEELPVLQRAAREFSRDIIAQGGRIALVGFHQRIFWMTPFTQDVERVDHAVAQLRPLGQTHLYDAVIQMLYELQKRPGRRALVVLTDGANQGGTFGLDHMIHYARYSGVPIYPVVRNTTLQRLMRFGVGRIQSRRIGKMAEETGATWFLINRPEQLPEVYRTIARELEHQYTLMFYPPHGTIDQWYSMQVQSRDGRKLRAPHGFFP